MEKILVAGGTGAMGVYLVPKLVARGYEVTVTHNDARLLERAQGANYIKTDMYDMGAVRELLGAGYDGVIDFMVYDTGAFGRYAPLYLDKTGQYISLSSYRVFANEETPIRETSPQLLNACKDEEFRYSNDYPIYKAKGECFLRGWRGKNYTIVRPAITYSKRRCQLINLERPQIFGAIKKNKPIVLCNEAMNVQATMSWAGDVAEMLARLFFNSAAFGEDFNVTTAEHCTWGEIAGYYADIFGAKFEIADKEAYLTARNGGKPCEKWQRWQLDYDRLFNRVMDNSKILAATGLKQSEFTSVRDGLAREQNTLKDDL